MADLSSVVASSSPDAAIKKWLGALVAHKLLPDPAPSIVGDHLKDLIARIPNNNNKAKRKLESSKLESSEESPAVRTTSHFAYRALNQLNTSHASYWECLGLCTALAACATTGALFSCCLCAKDQSAVDSYNYSRHLLGPCSGKLDNRGNLILLGGPTTTPPSPTIPPRALEYFGLLSQEQRHALLNKKELSTCVHEALRAAFERLPVAVAGDAAFIQQQVQQQQYAPLLQGTIDLSVLSLDPSSLAATLAPKASTGLAANFREDSDPNAPR